MREGERRERERERERERKKKYVIFLYSNIKILCFFISVLL